MLRDDFDAAQLSLCARQSDYSNQVRRLLTLVAIYDGASRLEAAEIGGVTRQIVRDWVKRLSTCGPEALIARMAAGESPLLTQDQRAALARLSRTAPRLRMVDLTQWAWDRFLVTISRQTLGHEQSAMQYCKLSARPRHHAQAQGAVEGLKRASPTL